MALSAKIKGDITCPCCGETFSYPPKSEDKPDPKKEKRLLTFGRFIKVMIISFIVFCFLSEIGVFK